MKKIILNGKWEMKACSEEKRLPATIPGSVLSCLLDNHEIEDPYYRENEYPTRELFWKDYAFSRSFEVTEELLQETKVELVCEGLDTLTEIYINSQFVAKTNNMHRTWRLDVKHQLRAGTNQIEVICRSTLRYIENYHAEPTKLIKDDVIGAMKGNQFIRKAHSMFGWDWGPQLPDAGIWRDIYIEGRSALRLQTPVFTQKHEEEKVELTVEVPYEALSDEEGSLCQEEKTPLQIMVSLTSPDGTVQSTKLSVDTSLYGVSEKVDRKGQSSLSGKAETIFTITNPQLWWPNGLGEHPLYLVKVMLCTDSKTDEVKQNGECVIDEKSYKIGLRTFTVSQQADQWGNEFAFVINGVKFFAMGADYIPEDCVYSRITLERQMYLIDSCVKANYNCLRVWGGGYYPSDAFYDLCDEKGIVVWQDLMYACNIYDVTDEFADNIVAETIENVTRLRHHASLGLWCGNNELESAWDHWDNFKIQTPYLRADYIKQFEYLLPKALKEADSQTFFWPSSPSSGGCFDDPDDENRGDTHYWAVWHGQKPFSDYQNYFFRFSSEFGFQSFPGSKTVESFTIEEDRNIFSPVMENHQKNDAANGKLLYYLAETFRYPRDFNSLLYDTQILQAIAIKSGVEHWRRNRGRCMGTLYWQVNDNWPVASWSSIDYYGRWKALHYFARNFYRPIAGSIVKCKDEDSFIRNGGEQFSGVEVHVENESFTDTSVKLVLRLKTMSFEVLDEKTAEVKVPAFSAVKVMEADYRPFIQRQPRVSVPPEQYRSSKLPGKAEVFVEAEFHYPDGRVQMESETFIPYKHMNLPKTEIKVEVTDYQQTAQSPDGYKITLAAEAFTPFVELDFADADVIFSDNYVTLTGRQPLTIYLDKKDIRRGSFSGPEDVRRRLQVRSLRDTY